MASSIIELYVDVPADRQANIFGQFDEHLKLIERTLNVTMIFRDGSLKILGSQEGATQARAIVEELNTLAGRGKYHHTAECELRTFPCHGEDRLRDGGDRQGFYL